MFSGENNISAMATLGAATAGTIMGVTAILYAQSHEKAKAKEEKLQRIRLRKQKYIEKKQLEQFINEASNQ